MNATNKRIYILGDLKFGGGIRVFVNVAKVSSAGVAGNLDSCESTPRCPSARVRTQGKVSESEQKACTTYLLCLKKFYKKGEA